MDKLHNARRAATVAVATTLFVVFGSFAANAVGSDTSTTINAKFTELLTDITTVYLPALLGLVVVGIGVRMGIKWLRKGASQA